MVNEAMASGLAVLVSSRYGCARALVVHGCNGYQFDPERLTEIVDCLFNLPRDETATQAMAAQSREIISRWTPELFGENLWHAVRTAVDCSRQRRAYRMKRLLPCWTQRLTHSEEEA